MNIFFIPVCNNLASLVIIPVCKRYRPRNIDMRQFLFDPKASGHKGPVFLRRTHALVAVGTRADIADEDPIPGRRSMRIIGDEGLAERFEIPSVRDGLEQVPRTGLLQKAHIGSPDDSLRITRRGRRRLGKTHLFFL